MEITTVNQIYLQAQNLKLQKLSRGYVWLDTGTHESMSEATEFVKAVEKRTSSKIACLEEIALNNNWIKKNEVKKAISFYGNCLYSNYLKKLV